MTAEKKIVPFNDLGRIEPGLHADIIDAITRVVGSGWFVMGPEHNALEKELAAFVGVECAALVANGTDALTLALCALGVTSDDLVLTCANAGGYTSIAAGALGATPVYADVDAVSYLVTVETVRAGVEHAVTTHGRQPACIVVTHLFGASADIVGITEWAHDRGIPVVEDCAQALGGVAGNARLGSIADISTTSFYPTKNLGALGDAGAVFTNRSDLDARVRSLRQYGWGAKYHNVVSGGMNSRCDEAQAAVLRLKLRQLDGWNERRRAIHAQYEQALTSPSARLLNSVRNDYVGHLAVVVVEDREAAARVFAEHGVKTDIHYPVCDHLQATAPAGAYSLPVSEYAAEHILSIPLFPELTDEETGRIVEALREL
ncbi:DegT/DnrJ/EryC1/StrS family aminotransferase [Klugiella xanthotipulae]|uniref:dTDP-4-amino-4,6-dideoxygalactose transaminase n=1 Tax=Klugiella xanthotipulae TaxID=244735 RepID=A0A543HGY3_9MICO|nr:DegT/DnrJ/EryC1/StrS family aminotransferase [Klugiella xanthotipulae]TQM57588.1 dTDP-4-amino-4,6-dideoxygalactose transaminase [Klugiella xanthotipulae]